MRSVTTNRSIVVVSSPSTLNAHLMGSGFRQATTGIDMAREDQLSPGTTLFRFIYSDIRKSPISGADGPWWLEAESFKRLLHIALSRGILLSRLAGSLSAIRAEWNEVNGYVQAEVVGPLKCWKGNGKQLRDTTRKRGRNRLAPVPVLQDVYQLYLPGVGGKGSLFSASLRYLSFTSIQSTQPAY
jgi:hypothetical protein